MDSCGGLVGRKAIRERLLEERGNRTSHIRRVADEEVAAGRVDNKFGTRDVRRGVFGRRVGVEQVVAAGDDQRRGRP